MKKVQMLSYDEAFHYQEMDVGAIYCEHGILLIKTGAGGSIRGRGDKYLHLVRHAQEMYGFAAFTVTTGSMPQVETEMKQAMEIVSRYRTYLGRDVPVYFFGMSKGALEGAVCLYRYDIVSRALLINMPLMINWHKSKAGFEQFTGESITTVFSTRDPSYRYSEIMQCVKNDRVQLYIDKDKNHSYDGAEAKLIELSERFLFY